MAKMRFAAAAHDLGSVHPMRMVGGIKETPLAYGLEETWPAAAAFEFGVAAEQGVTANGAVVCSNLFGFFKGTAPWPFRAFIARDLIDIFWQQLFPLFIVQIHRGAIGMRVQRILFVFWVHGEKC